VAPGAWAPGAQPLGDPATTWQLATTVTLTPNDVVLVAAATGVASPAAAATMAAVRSRPVILSTHAPDHANRATRLSPRTCMAVKAELASEGPGNSPQAAAPQKNRVTVIVS
jgi:hypothetical protein